MEQLLRLIEIIANILGQYGVPEVYRTTGAMAVLYVLATLVVILLILIVFRLSRKKEGLPSEELVEEGPIVEEEVEPSALPEEEVAETEPEEAPAEEVAAPLHEVVEEELEEAEAPVAEVPVAPPEEVIKEVEKEIPAVEEKPEVLEEVEVKPAPSLFERMRVGLAKTHSSLMGRIDALLSAGQTVDEDLLEELEEILVTADFGMKTTQDLIQALEKRTAKGETGTTEALRDALKEEIRSRVRLEAEPLDVKAASPFVIMVVGVNGVGKTTTIGKLANQLASDGKKVVLGAGDTFRAAAAEQLAIWGERAGVDVIRHAEGADPAAVAFDAAKAAVSRNADVLILDTAGRLHTKVNLMEEMKKIRRVLAREIPGAPHETLLVLDATTGQNAIVQARLFKEAVDVSGIALTKLDGTAKGGMVVAIGVELGVPVRFVGIGEGIDDLRSFDPDIFVDALFQKD